MKIVFLDLLEGGFYAWVAACNPLMMMANLPYVYVEGSAAISW